MAYRTESARHHIGASSASGPVTTLRQAMRAGMLGSDVFDDGEWRRMVVKVFAHRLTDP
jgi:hypothetical protein